MKYLLVSLLLLFAGCAIVLGERNSVHIDAEGSLRREVDKGAPLPGELVLDVVNVQASAPSRR